MNRKNLRLIAELTIADFRLRDQGSLLGFFWTLLHPVLMFTVLYLIFSKWTGQKIEHFAAYLLIGIVQWNFFATATEVALRSIVVKRELVREINFPREVLVISSVLTIFLSYLGELVVLFVLLFFVMGIPFRPGVLLLPFIILVETILILGISFVLAAIFVFWRDIERIWSILIKIGFFATPIFYPISVIAEEKQIWLFLNPMTHIVHAARAVFLSQDIDIVGLTGVSFVSALVFVLGYAFFKRIETKFAEVL